MRDTFRGVGVALITPFNEDYSIDYHALEVLVNDQIAGGVDYLVVNGTTSEASTLSESEKRDILKFILKINNNRKPILYGIGANNTHQVVDLIKATDFTGIEGILTVSPYYNKPSQAGIVAHYQMVADHSPVPVLLYNVPSRTGINMSYQTTLELANHPNIFGIKEASGDLEQCLNIMKRKPSDFMLISGDDLLTIPMVAIGAEGVISVLSNAYPKEFSSCIHQSLNGDFRSATSALTAFLPLNDFMYVESNPVGVKEVLYQKGKITPQVRLPLLKASAELQENIKKSLI